MLLFFFYRVSKYYSLFVSTTTRVCHLVSLECGPKLRLMDISMFMVVRFHEFYSLVLLVGFFWILIKFNYIFIIVFIFWAYFSFIGFWCTSCAYSLYVSSLYILYSLSLLFIQLFVYKQSNT